MNFSGQAPLLFAHIGDLHINGAKDRNYLDFLSIIVQLRVECGNKIDFVYLPGDIADHGQREQYKLVAAALKMLDVPVHLVAGDHDMEQNSLQNLYTELNASPLPKAITLKGVRCIFIDVNGPGEGGPDFRLGDQQLKWLENELGEPVKDMPVCLFMHTHPDDLKDPGEKSKLNELIERNNILLVDMGHTHYNELTNDNGTIYAATRSTGQIEEGPVGYALISIDNGIVSWRFKLLDATFPYVHITSPADHRLLTNNEQICNDAIMIQAIVLGDHDIESVVCYLDEGEVTEMTKTKNQTWFAQLPGFNADKATLTVEATDITGRIGNHSIIIAGPAYEVKVKQRFGSDANRIASWIDNGIPGTQLGPNRNAKPIK